MIELNRPSKRRLSNADENERIALRQMVLNMSICKLQKDQGRKEPSLFRSVVISNTVRNIENEMDEEIMNDYNEDSYFPYYCDDHYKNEKLISVNKKQNDDDKQKQEDPVEPNKFGAIGDRRKTKAEESTIITTTPILSGFSWDNVVIPKTFPHLENMEFGNDFHNIDLALYDYDRIAPFSKPPSYASDIFLNSCAVEYEKHKPDAFFEEIEQIMQVLVGI